SITVQAASTVIVTDDDVGAVEIATNRRTNALGLRLIAPTVLISPLDPVTVTEGLRAAGFLPVLQGDRVEVSGTRTRAGDDEATDGAIDPTGGLPADWTGPAIPAGPFPDEVADAVATLLGIDDGLDPMVEIDPSVGQNARPAGAAHAPEPGAGPVGTDPSEASTLGSQLAKLWGRPVRLRSAGASGADEVSGVVVGLGPSVSVLTLTEVVEIPTASVLSVDHLDQV
ncbi:MAG: hypothetical protein AAFO29_24340, partial [Actinomycetota bacterium]